MHQRLTQRFVDRRQAALQRRLKEGGPLLAAVTRDDEVLVEGQYVGRLEGFRFVLDASAINVRPMLAAARRAITASMPARLRAFEASPDSGFFPQRGWKTPLAWRTGRPAGGRHLAIAAEDRAASGEQLAAGARELLRERSDQFFSAYRRHHLGALVKLERLGSPMARRGSGLPPPASTGYAQTS